MAILEDGFKSLIAIGGITGQFEEVSFTPLSVDSGGTIDMTTMRNTRSRTAAGKKLITYGTGELKVIYDPRVFAQMQGAVGSNRAVTQTWPDGATLVWYAIIEKIEFDELTEGNRPEATITLTPSNRTTAAIPVETAPVFATGTTPTTTTTALP
jgi:hypothetical protein